MAYVTSRQNLQFVHREKSVLIEMHNFSCSYAATINWPLSRVTRCFIQYGLVLTFLYSARRLTKSLLRMRRI